MNPNYHDHTGKLTPEGELAAEKFRSELRAAIERTDSNNLLRLKGHGVIIEDGEVRLPRTSDYVGLTLPWREIQQDPDGIRHWVDERVRHSEGAKNAIGVVYQNYIEYCEKMLLLRPASSRRLGKQLNLRGFSRRYSGKREGWIYDNLELAN